MSVDNEITMPANGDFLVGGKGKDFSQIADLPGSYLAVDNVEIGVGNRIPLWMLGLLY